MNKTQLILINKLDILHVYFELEFQLIIPYNKFNNMTDDLRSRK